MEKEIDKPRVPGRHDVLAGDLLLLRGRGALRPFNLAVQRVKGGYPCLFTHVAIVAGPMLIVDAIPKVGVTFRAWHEIEDTFDLDASRVTRHCRLALDQGTAQEVLRHALYYLRQPYHLQRLLRVDGPIRDCGGLVCSHFVAAVLQRMKVQVTECAAESTWPFHIDRYTQHSGHWQRFPLRDYGLCADTPSPDHKTAEAQSVLAQPRAVKEVDTEDPAPSLAASFRQFEATTQRIRAVKRIHERRLATSPKVDVDARPAPEPAPDLSRLSTAELIAHVTADLERSEVMMRELSAKQTRQQTIDDQRQMDQQLEATAAALCAFINSVPSTTRALSDLEALRLSVAEAIAGGSAEAQRAVHNSAGCVDGATPPGGKLATAPQLLATWRRLYAASPPRAMSLHEDEQHALTVDRKRALLDMQTRQLQDIARELAAVKNRLDRLLNAPAGLGFELLAAMRPVVAGLLTHVDLLTGDEVAGVVEARLVNGYSAAWCEAEATIASDVAERAVHALVALSRLDQERLRWLLMDGPQLRCWLIELDQLPKRG